MAYEKWEYDHDKQLVQDFQEATITEIETDTGIQLQFSGLTGYIAFCDGYMTWGVLGIMNGKETPVDQKNIDNDTKRLMEYGRKCVESELKRVANEAIASAKRRLEQWQG